MLFRGHFSRGLAMCRVVGLLLVALLSVSLLAGCGGSGTPGKNSDADKPAAGR